MPNRSRHGITGLATWRLLPYLAAVLALSSWSGAARAEDASSSSYRALNVTLSGGGGALVNQGTGETARAEVTIAAPEPLAEMRGNNITAQLGFWPTVVAAPEPASSSLGAVAGLSLLLLSLHRRSRRERD